MKPNFRAGIALAAIGVCGSCSPSFLIQAYGQGVLVHLAFVDTGLIWSSTMTACVSELTIQAEEWPTRAYEGDVWKIKAREKCVELRGVEIGKVPDGFYEEVDRLPLRVGETYGASAVAEPFHGMSQSLAVCVGELETLDWADEYRLEAASPACTS